VCAGPCVDDRDRIRLALRGGLDWRHAFGNITLDAQLGFAAGANDNSAWLNLSLRF
jgi:hypothetical protein